MLNVLGPEEILAGHTHLRSFLKQVFTSTGVGLRDLIVEVVFLCPPGIVLRHWSKFVTRKSVNLDQYPILGVCVFFGSFSGIKQNERRSISMIIPKCSELVLKMFRPVNETMRQTVSEVEMVAMVASTFGHPPSGDLSVV